MKKRRISLVQRRWNGEIVGFENIRKYEYFDAAFECKSSETSPWKVDRSGGFHGRLAGEKNFIFPTRNQAFQIPRYCWTLHKITFKFVFVFFINRFESYAEVDRVYPFGIYERWKLPWYSIFRTREFTLLRFMRKELSPEEPCPILSIWLIRARYWRKFQRPRAQCTALSSAKHP